MTAAGARAREMNHRGLFLLFAALVVATVEAHACRECANGPGVRNACNTTAAACRADAECNATCWTPFVTPNGTSFNRGACEQVFWWHVYRVQCLCAECPAECAWYCSVPQSGGSLSGWAIAVIVLTSVFVATAVVGGIVYARTGPANDGYKIVERGIARYTRV